MIKNLAIILLAILSLKVCRGQSASGNISASGQICGGCAITVLTPTMSDGQAAQIEFLSTIKTSTPSPLVIYFHGAGESQTDCFTNTDIPGEKRLTDALIEARYIVASSNGSGNNWGNQTAQDNYYTLYAYIKGLYNITQVFFIGQSMGGVASLNLIVSGRVPVIAWYGIYPVTNLANMYGGGSGTYASQIQTAYGFGGPSGYAAATAGFDPNLDLGSSFSAVNRFRMTSSYSDTVVVRSQNTDLLVAKLVAASITATVLTSTGNHGNDSNIVPSDALAFF